MVVWVGKTLFLNFLAGWVPINHINIDLTTTCRGPSAMLPRGRRLVNG
ncbi:hypothetical protein NON20_22425 [Synechocystis sp. B12]|nr:hypothetical protein NON20_22425 [Synechocystis sp. B12]